VVKQQPVETIAKNATTIPSAKLAETAVIMPMRSARHASRSTPFVDAENEFCTTRVETFALRASSSVLFVHVDARSSTTKVALGARLVSRHLDKSQDATPMAVWDVVNRM
jgi:hypothetical protein